MYVFPTTSPPPLIPKKASPCRCFQAYTPSLTPSPNSFRISFSPPLYQAQTLISPIFAIPHSRNQLGRLSLAPKHILLRMQRQGKQPFLSSSPLPPSPHNIGEIKKLTPLRVSAPRRIRLFLPHLQPRSLLHTLWQRQAAPTSSQVFRSSDGGREHTAAK